MSDRTPPKRPNFALPKPPLHRDQRTPSQRLPQPVQPVALSAEPILPLVNSRKWHLDENTGEYLRIKHRRGDRVIVDTTPYNHRWMESVLAEHELLKLTALTVGCLIGGTVFWAIAVNTRKPDCIMPGIFAIALFLSSAGTFIELFCKLGTEAFRDIGPEPVSQRPRREQAEQQRVHGTGRFMNRDEIHRAASGETASEMEEQQYED